MGRTLDDLDFVGLYATRKRLEDPVSSDPAGLGSGDAGRVWFNTVSAKWKYWNGSAAIDVVARTNHTGTQLASTISDFDSQVHTSTLNQMTAPSADLSIGSHKLTNVSDGVGTNDGVNKGQLDAAIAALTAGQVIKGAVVCAATTNVSLSTPGATIDGITMSNPMTILLAGQTTGTQNGPYVWTGASTALTRAPNWDSSGEAVLGSYWVVEQGSKADQYALLTNDTAITLGTDTPAFTFIGGTSLTGTPPIVISSGAVSISLGDGLTTSGGNAVVDRATVPKKITGLIPTATAGIVTVSGATVTINHGLNTWVPLVVITAYSSAYTGYTTGDVIGPGLNGFTAQDANNVVGILPAAPASNNWAYGIYG